ncbi:TRAP transporter substrate-binding protein DctP [Ornithinicoccus hortensis]|uniref:Tripartite ATP-independent transporter DctP family solute receptor n=1 Tax=Ornithinicoccus hortensis TaxID=82346 RepID=A0A542YWL4_9MICO|nr:TRAP transporter substrate-binding protein DctP [Ornithinicoccus hortensis]TQL52482.1 tripartite ATP-independent transporter DctP family solute receptor [Ornithinicoccus hortensis]
MRTRSLALTVTAVAAALGLSACGDSVPIGDDGQFEGNITFSLALGDGSHHHVGAKAFGDKLTELSDGRITVSYYYDNALGGEREVVEGMLIDSIDMGITSTGPIGGFVDEFFVFDLPYLFENHEHAHAVLDSEIGDELTDLLKETANVQILAWMENGFRHQTNSVRPINTPEDLEGIDHRTQESQVQIDTWSALGANATPMAWPEVYTALQQGVMDSQENPLPTIVDVRFFEVQDYLALTQHVYSPAPMMMSGKLWDSLSEEDQAMFQEAADYALPIQREASYEQEQEAVATLESEGMEVTEPDLDLFREAVEPVYEKWAPQLGEDRIEAARNFDH